MAEDLYAQWLLVPAGARPPDHYALLGLPQFEADIAAIERATRSQLARLDKYAIHPEPSKRDACHRMMNEVARARIVLVSPERKKNYDIDLKSQGGSVPRPARENTPRAANGTAEPEQDSKLVTATPRRLVAMIAGWDRQIWIYAGLVVAVIIGVALIGYRLMSPAPTQTLQPIRQVMASTHLAPASQPASEAYRRSTIADAQADLPIAIRSGLLFLGRFEGDSLTKQGDVLVLKDSSGQGNNGIVNGCKVVPGRGRDAMEFDGRGDFVNLSDSKIRIEGPSPRTIVAWVKATTTPDYNGSIFSLGNGNRDNSFDFMVSREGILRVDKTSGGGIPLDLRDKWHFVADTYDGEQHTLFVDDQITFISSTQHFDNATSNVYIGKFSYHGFGMYYAGMIDELGVWNRALSQREVRALYTATADGTSLAAIHSSTPASVAASATVRATSSEPAPVIPVPVRTVTLTLKATIDGSDFVAINASGATWTHRTWSWPSDVTLNGVPWNPEAQSVLDSTGALAFLKDVDFSTASVVGRSGRDTVAMEKTNDGISVYFADPDNGSDSYEITITLRYK